MNPTKTTVYEILARAEREIGKLAAEAPEAVEVESIMGRTLACPNPDCGAVNNFREHDWDSGRWNETDTADSGGKLLLSVYQSGSEHTYENLAYFCESCDWIVRIPLHVNVVFD